MDTAIHRINHYPVDKYYGKQTRYPLDRDISRGYRYPPFEQQWPSVYLCLENMSVTWLASTIMLISLWACLQSSLVTNVSDVPFLLQDNRPSKVSLQSKHRMICLCRIKMKNFRGGSRINTDRFLNRGSRAQASRQVRGMHLSEIFLISTPQSHLS